MECLMSAFHHFLQSLFQNYQGRPSVANFSLLTWWIVINKYVRLQNSLLWRVCSSDIVDFVAPIIFVASISGYIWLLSWIFMFLLKSSKLFVTNVSTILILGILIYHIQHYWFCQGECIIKNSTLVDLGRERFLGQNCQPSSILVPLYDQDTVLNNFVIFCTIKNIFRDKGSGSRIIRSWGVEYF